jgi:collagenase-like PrtC family protease
MPVFSAPSRFDPEEIGTIAALNLEAAGTAAVRELHGSLPRSVVGSGRISYSLPDLDPDGLSRYVASAHRHGIEFNHLLNAPCMGNREFTCDGIRELDRLLDLLSSAGVDWVTVTIPFLVEFIRRRGYPLKVNASVIARIDDIPKARLFRDLGAQRITLSTDINRDFDMLHAIRREISLPLELLVNSACLPDCPFAFPHYAFVGHHSQMEPADPSLALPFEYYLARCHLIRLDRRELLLRRGFIRPEDIARYEAIGIDLFKIQGRDLPSGSVRTAVAAYLSGRFDGNLSVLLGEVAHDDPAPIFTIDNRALDGFLDRFQDRGCSRRLGCEGCSHCAEATERALRIDESAAAAYRERAGRKTEITFGIDRLVEERFRSGIEKLLGCRSPGTPPAGSPPRKGD